MAVFTQEDLDNLKAAYASGELEVWYGGRKVTHRSIRELERAITVVSVELAKQSETKPTQFVQVVTSKGV